MTLEQAFLIASLRGAEYQALDSLGIFGMPRYRVDRVVRQNIGKGRLPKRVLVRSLNGINARLPRTRQWHIVANQVVANMSPGMLNRSTYESLARNIKLNIDAKNQIKKKPALATILHWLKTHPSANEAILDFRLNKRAIPGFTG